MYRSMDTIHWKILKEQSDNEKLPSMKYLKSKKEDLTALKASQYETYQNLHRYEKELKTVCTNVDMILGKDHSMHTEKSQDIS